MPTAEVADVLLTPSESNVLSSFLSAVDRLDPNTPQFLSPEWNMYAATLSNQVHLQEGKEDLARATKDLIGSGFGPGEAAAAGSFHAVAPHLYNPVQSRGAHGGQAFGSSSRKLSSASGADGTQLPHAFLQNARSWPSVPQSSSGTQNAITFNPYGMVPPQSLSFNGARGSFPSSRPSLAAISTSLPGSSVSGPLSATPTTARPPLSAASSVSQGASRKRPSLEVRHPASAPAGVSLESNKRPRPSPPDFAGSSGAHRSSLVVSRDSESTSPQVSRSSISRASFSSTPANGKSFSASRRNTVTTSPRSSSSTSGSGPSPPPEASSSTGPPKQQQLLTAEQKKLNHIHSEQKRRANIRRGYDALCDVVPALREAIRAEEAECANTGKKRGRGKLLGEDGEKMDGRAGPRSESVVLQKTIEQINELLAQRSSYLERLQAAKAALPPGHPALLSVSQGEQPWEKMWNGGVGLPLGGEPMDQDGDDDEGGSEDGE